MRDQIGKRMKSNYEDRYRLYLTRRTPVIMRLDGVAFHTLTKKMQRPFDLNFIDAMVRTARHLVSFIQGAKCGYVQSDEISILITDFDKLTTAAWFDYNIQKMTSVAASLASLQFMQTSTLPGAFDCRVFNIPKEEVVNYFVWRQKDWMRNSIQMMGQSRFSPRQLHGKSCTAIKDMLLEKKIDYNTIPDIHRYGTFMSRNDTCHFDFTQNRDVIERLIVQG
jgi:tRNA(His) guanylyltransferase